MPPDLRALEKASHDPVQIALMAVKPCRGWLLWWRFGFTPILAVVNRLPMAEWRKEAISWHIDIAAMDAHKRLHKPPGESGG